MRRPWLRRQLGERLTMRHIPQLVIRHDDSIEAGDRVLRLLRELEEGRDAMSREAVARRRSAAPTRITAICHENPDADTLGSALALRMAAERLGKQAEVVAADPVPPFLAGLPRARPRSARAPGLEPDLAVVVDGPPSRTGAVARDCGEWLARARIVNIDHHVSNDGSEAAVAWVDPDAAATCEMVALLLPDLGVEIDARDRHRADRRHRAGHAHLLAPERHAAHAARRRPTSSRPVPRCRALHRAIYADKPFSTLALWGRILAGIGAAARRPDRPCRA